MSYDTLTQASTPLRPQNLIADEVMRLGLLPVLAAALRAWWRRPRLPPDLPQHLREDLGLPPPNVNRHWTEVGFATVDFDRYT
ncbi:hypothetical protein PSQ90_03965 [Devosia rhodophyticola]|uniref:DUF1127 domain-containing protein n=1 Tax=Devosia rhodophyticola TaxID=3026423 RepID=A0ABY7YZX4_9HYPH|nr:hypothetical protein [Devosia rhodophyticola]WDR06628.1 hypothetical protein PSQ90_03965 [Devosia rhodophyticola]